MSNPFLTKHTITPEDVAEQNRKFDHHGRYGYNSQGDKEHIEKADKRHYSLDEYQERRRSYPHQHDREMGTPYGSGYNMAHHGEGKKHGEK